MIEQYDQTNETERLDFARKAAEYFAEHPACVTYAPNGPEKGKLYALRWGMGNDCVVVFRISDDYDDKITNYTQFIPRDKAELSCVFEKGGLDAVEALKKRKGE